MELYSLLFIENMIYKDSNGGFKYRIKFNFKLKINIRIMTYKIVRSKSLCDNYEFNQKSNI